MGYFTYFAYCVLVSTYQIIFLYLLLNIFLFEANTVWKPGQDLRLLICDKAGAGLSIWGHRLVIGTGVVQG